MDDATEASYREMLRCIKYVVDTPDRGLKVEPKSLKEFVWELVLWTDSDWGGDKEDRRSISGFMLFLNGVLISWRSRSQRQVALSSSEAEFYACSEAVKEIPFVVQILLFLGVPVELPVVVKVDNIGAIFMTENATSSVKTRHMDMRYRYVVELQNSGLIKTTFVPTKLNVSDVETNNVTGEVQDANIDVYSSEKKALEIE